MSAGRTFPMKAQRHGGENDRPATTPVWGLFDARGYWSNLAGIIFQMPDDPANQRTVRMVADLVNSAYEQGKADKLAEFQAVLGIET